MIVMFNFPKKEKKGENIAVDWIHLQTLTMV
jgi:hypothetical protein